jgi:hypothetical protein
LFKSSQATLITIGPPATHMLKNWYSTTKAVKQKTKTMEIQQQPTTRKPQQSTQTKNTTPRKPLGVFYPTTKT